MSTTEPVAVPAIVQLPTPDDVDRIAALDDDRIRNLRITHTYHLLTVAFAAAVTGGANWCTFAVWASKQAGCSIRGEDVPQALHRALHAPPERAGRVDRLWRRLVWGAIDHAGPLRERLLRALWDPMEVVRRTSAAVARGNRKVFAEIGREFARFLAVCGPGPVAPDVLEAFLAGLRPGPPPDGQDALRDAFIHYAAAISATDARGRAERLLLANLLCGQHEQTRLQPDILAAMEMPVITLREMRQRRLEILFPFAARWPGLARLPLVAAIAAFGKAVDPVVRAAERHAITEALMTLALPDGVIRLGRDLTGELPASLRDPTLAELVELLAQVRPAPDDPDGVGAWDWSALGERMQMIARLFQLRQEDAGLFIPPFTPEQVARFEAGELPDGNL